MAGISISVLAGLKSRYIGDIMENHCGMCALSPYPLGGCPEAKHGKRACLMFQGKTIANCVEHDGCQREVIDGCEDCPVNILKFRDLI